MAMTKKAAIKEKLKLYQQQAQDTRKLYDTQIFETGRAYEDDYRENAVQKAINERQVAESMANMGLSDSGLNRTQSTAVQLSYGNNKAAIDKAKRQAIDSLELQKMSDLSTVRQNWLADKASINQTYIGSGSTNNKGTAESVTLPTGGFILNNGSTIDKSMQGTLWSNGIEVTPQKDGNGNITGYKYYDRNSKKTTIFPAGTNPFTGNDNAKESNTDTGMAYKKYGAFENGYQPKGVFYKENDYGWVKGVEDRTPINGNMQNVHKTDKNGEIKYWLWDRNKNAYIEVFVNEDGEWEEKVG